MAQADFETLVAEALDAVPAGLAELIDNCVIMVEPDPPADEPGLLGLYEGVPLTERDSHYQGVLPDRIVIFMNPILAVSASHADVVAEVRTTVVHEIAHHFGIDDDRLDELGWS